MSFAFTDGFLLMLLNHEDATLKGINKIHVVPTGIFSPPSLELYQFMPHTEGTALHAICVQRVALTRLWLPTHPHLPPNSLPACPSPIK